MLIRMIYHDQRNTTKLIGYVTLSTETYSLRFFYVNITKHNNSLYIVLFVM